MPHRTRLIALVCLFTVSVAGLIAAVALDLGMELKGLFEGWLALLVPAVLDALHVERRRRDPSIPALPDDDLAPSALSGDAR